MKKLIAVLLTVAILSTSMIGCGNEKVVNGVMYDTYGLINETDKRNPDIQYELITGNVIWGGILFASVWAPIYFFGFSMYEPVGTKVEIIGQVTR